MRRDYLDLTTLVHDEKIYHHLPLSRNIAADSKQLLDCQREFGVHE